MFASVIDDSKLDVDFLYFFVFVDYANKLSPTLKSFMFASACSDCPDFLFDILIEEGQRIISMLMSTRYRTYQDAF